MATIHDFYSGKAIRKATVEEYTQYKIELSKKSKEGQLSGEVDGRKFGQKGLIYMQDYSNKGTGLLKSEITYFEQAGNKNSEETFKLAKKRALERGIGTVAIASIRGRSAEKALEIFKDTNIKLLMCTCNACNECDRFSEDVWKKVEEAGHHVVYTNEDVIQIPPAAALAYRRICEGMKVCVQISMSLVDQGIISPNTEIIAVAGTGGKSYSKGWGSDTAIVINAVGSDKYWKYPENLKEHKLHARKIKEIICMPR